MAKKFINGFLSKDNAQEKYPDYYIASSYYTVTELVSMLESKKKVIIPDICRNFSITDKGGKRLINFLKAILSSDADILAFYQSSSIKYLLEVSPGKLQNYAGVAINKLINTLTNPEYLVVTGGVDYLYPISFSTDSGLSKWIFSVDPTLALELLNQIRAKKASDEDFLEKDIVSFSDDFPASNELSSKYAIDNKKILKSFSKLLI